jgi:ribonuclease D
LGRSSWLAEDSARQLANAANEEGERWPHLVMRSAQFLDAPAQRRLLRLLRWRDAHARRSDKPTQLDPGQRAGGDPSPRQPRRAGRPCKRSWMPRRRPRRACAIRSGKRCRPPWRTKTNAPLARGEDRDKKQLRAMQDAVLAVAGELGVPEGVLASRKLLEALQDGGGWSGPLAGWRRGVLEARLQPLLAGTTTA